MESRRGVVLANTGSPDEPTPEAVRKYLEAFLSDPRICPMNPRLWSIILHRFILPRRSRASAQKYAAIWTPEGSPLKMGMASLACKVQEELSALGCDWPVEVGMSYGSPSIQDALEALRCAGCREAIVVPLFPQAAFSTTYAVADKVKDAVASMVDPPRITMVEGYADDERYLDAIADFVRASGFDANANDKLLFAFHSIPIPDIKAGDTYGECAHATAQEVAVRLHLDPEDWRIGFQCRFDKSRAWLGPFVLDALATLPEPTGALHVVAPNFAIDCLETIYDIDQVLRAHYCSEHPGHTLRYIPCLNDADAHAQLLAGIIASRA